jgi:hypothetical protein
MIAAAPFHSRPAKKRLQHTIGTCAIFLSPWASAQSGIPDPSSELQRQKTSIGRPFGVSDPLPSTKSCKLMVPIKQVTPSSPFKAVLIGCQVWTWLFMAQKKPMRPTRSNGISLLANPSQIYFFHHKKAAPEMFLDRPNLDFLTH